MADSEPSSLDATSRLNPVVRTYVVADDKNSQKRFWLIYFCLSGVLMFIGGPILEIFLVQPLITLLLKVRLADPTDPIPYPLSHSLIVRTTGCGHRHARHGLLRPAPAEPDVSRRCHGRVLPVEYHERAGVAGRHRGARLRRDRPVRLQDERGPV